MGHSNRKIRTALYIGIGASILSVIALAMVVLYPYFLAKDMRSNGRDHVQKYATEYDLDHGEMRAVLDNWNIAKRSKNWISQWIICISKFTTAKQMLK